MELRVSIPANAGQIAHNVFRSPASARHNNTFRSEPIQFPAVDVNNLNGLGTLGLFLMLHGHDG
jgi:hypothetical protein